MRLIFAGTPDIAAESLEQLANHHEIALVITKPDAPQGRKRIMTQSAVARVASDLGLRILKTSSIREAELAEIANAQAELAIVVAYGSLIPKLALDALPWWNLHFSMLPKWRGATPLQHSMMAGNGIGISLFELEAGLDTGPIVKQREMSFEVAETAGEALFRFTKEGTKLILESIGTNVTSNPQQGEASHAPKITRAEAKLEFRGHADLVAAKINALNPEPMAWSEMSRESIRLLRAAPHLVLDSLQEFEVLTPGEVVMEGQFVIVGCGGGTRLRLLEVQPAGKRAMASGDWFRGLIEPVKFD
jgi:methionyl-tRNA formyltransferase